MKKILSCLMVLAFSLAGAGAFYSEAYGTAIAAGSVIKGEGLSTLYYLGEDGKRYVFPNDKTYFSWYEDFSDVLTLPQEELSNYPLGGNVRYKPGKVLVKIQTDPKVYAVGENGQLRWVKTENLARKLYGANWNLLVDDVPDPFFTNYRLSQAVENEEDFDPAEEEDGIPTPGHNLGFKPRQAAGKAETLAERRCQRLETLIERVQKRLKRFGLSAPELGSDYLDECFADDNDSGQAAKKRWRWHEAGKIAICHFPPDGSSAFTINVSLNAAKAHLAHGDTLGACGSAEEEEDTKPPVISALSAATGTESALISWLTDEAADGTVYYATSTISAGTFTLQKSESGAATTSHQIMLDGLSSGAYFYYVRSADSAGNPAKSPEYGFVID